MFTAKVTSVQDVEAVARAFVRHNNSPMEPLGGTYDRDTFAALDPKRFQVLVQMQQRNGTQLQQQKVVLQKQMSEMPEWAKQFVAAAANGLPNASFGNQLAVASPPPGV